MKKEKNEFSRKFKVSKMIIEATFDNFCMEVDAEREVIFHNLGQSYKLFEVCRIALIFSKFFKSGNFAEFRLEIVKLLFEKVYFQVWI